MILAEFTSNEYLLLITALGVLLTTLGGVIVSIVVAVKASAKTDVIEGHVNSKSTASDLKLDGLQREIASLKSERAKQEQKEALRAQAEVRPFASNPETPVKVTVENEPHDPVPTEMIKNKPTKQ